MTATVFWPSAICLCSKVHLLPSPLPGDIGDLSWPDGSAHDVGVSFLS